MKKSKIIIPALAMLVLSSAATVTGTVAWFTMNTTAKAEGMVVSAKTSGSLIIKEANLTNPALPTNSDKATKVTFPSTAHAFYPSTHDNASPTLLKYVSNGDRVNYETGTRMNEDTTLTYENVGSDDSNYYFDYGVYLAGDGMSMNKVLTISIDNAAELSVNGALSIDFYGLAVTTDTFVTAGSGTFLGTLNLAKKYNDTQYSSAAKTQIVTQNPVTIGNSKAGVADHGAYAILMRTYYDGALIQAGQTDNDFADYTPCASDELAVANLLYYTDDAGTAIVPRNVGDSVSGLYKVNLSTSTLCFARSISVINIEQRSLDVTFSC